MKEISNRMATSLENGEKCGSLLVVRNMGRGPRGDDRNMNSSLILLSFSGSGGIIPTRHLDI